MISEKILLRLADIAFEKFYHIDLRLKYNYINSIILKKIKKIIEVKDPIFIDSCNCENNCSKLFLYTNSSGNILLLYPYSLYIHQYKRYYYSCVNS